MYNEIIQRFFSMIKVTSQQIHGHSEPGRKKIDQWGLFFSGWLQIKVMITLFFGGAPPTDGVELLCE